MAEQVKVRIITETTGEADIRRADNALTQLKANASSTGSVFKQAFSGIAGFFAVSELAQAGRAILTIGSQMEQAKVSFTTFTGSAEKAGKLLTDMQDFANLTPFNTDETIEAGKMLSAYGIEAERIIPTLKSIGDVAAGTGKPIKELAYLFGTMNSQGIVYTQDLNQLGNAGIPIYRILAKQLGVSTSEVRKMASESKISFATVQNAFAGMTSEGGQFFNLMENQSLTTGGKWSNFVGLLQLGGIQIFNALQPFINQLIDLATQYLPVAIDYARGLWHELGIAAKWVKQNADWLKPLAVAVLGAAAAYRVYTLALKVQGAWTAIVTTAQYYLNAAMTANPIGIVVVAIGALVGALVYLFNTNEKVRGTLLALWNVTKTLFKGIYDAAKLYLLSTGKLIKGIFTFDGEALKEAITGFASGAKDIAVNTVKGSVQGVRDGFTQAAADMKAKGEEAKAGGTAARKFMGLTTVDDKTPPGGDNKTKDGKGSAVSSVSGSRPTSVHLHINKLIGVETLKSDLSNLKRGEVPQMSDSLLATLTRLLTDVEQYAL